jgi:hypothetical protein
MDVKHRVANTLNTIMTVRARLLNALKFCIFLKSLFLYLTFWSRNFLLNRMQRLEVSGAVLYIYVIRRLKVK